MEMFGSKITVSISGKQICEVKMYALIFAIALSTVPDLMTMGTYQTIEECNAVAFEVEQHIDGDNDSMVFCISK